MKKAEIKQGGFYTARISGNFVTVRVDSIGERPDYHGNMRTVYGVTNMKTKRTTVFRSATRFRGIARDPAQVQAAKDAEQHQLCERIKQHNAELAKTHQFDPLTGRIPDQSKED